MKDETMAGYYQLLIAIFCNLNAREARYLYDYGPAHPVCRRMMYRKLKASKTRRMSFRGRNFRKAGSVGKEWMFYREKKGA